MAVSQVGFSLSPYKNEQKQGVVNPFTGINWSTVCSTLSNTQDFLSSYRFAAEKMDSVSNTVPFHKTLGLSPDDAFPFWEDTDLEIITDDAEPRKFNQIRKSDARSALELYNEIADGKTNMKIEGSSDFKKRILENVKILLTRPLGRQLIGTACSLKGFVVIREGEKNMTKCQDGKLMVSLKLDPDASSITKCQDSQGNVTFQPTTAYLILAHELIHVLHRDAIMAAKDISALSGPSPHPLFKNLSEQLTIVGLVSDPELISENAIRAEFGLNARVSHRASKFLSYTPEDLAVIDTPNESGATRLENAMRLNAYGEICKLLEAGANPGIGYVSAILNDEPDMIEFLLHRGADPNRPDNDGDLPLHMAVLEDQRDVVKLLLKGGALADKLDGEGHTALEIALEKSHLVCALILIKKGAPLTQKALECLEPKCRRRLLAKVPPEMNQTDPAMSESESDESETEVSKKSSQKKRSRSPTPPESKAEDKPNKRSRHR